MSDPTIAVAIISASGAIVVAGLGLLGTMITNSKKKKCKEDEKHIELIKSVESVKDEVVKQDLKLDLVISGEKHLLLKNLEDMANLFRKNSFDDISLSEEDYKKFNEQYNCYHALGGNGYADGLKQLVDRLYVESKLGE